MNRPILTALCIFFLPLHLLYAAPQATDEAVLEKLNLEIAAAEDRGDRKWLETVLAPEMAFRRASGVVVGRTQFLDGVKPRTPSKTNIESIHFYGTERAVVTCTVTLEVDGNDAEFHNVRIFIRDGVSWKLLAWANERVNQK